MQSRFAQFIDRKNTDSIKYDFAARFGKPDDALPLWVADMDFQAPPEVIDVLVQRSRHGIFGYSETKDDYFTIVAEWMQNAFNWQVQPQWLVKCSGVILSICTAIRALTEPEDAILIQQPVYHPFPEIIKNNGRRAVINQLLYQAGHYQIDWDDFAVKIKQQKVKMFILCSPHNPVGRVWTKQELLQLGDICSRHNVLVVSDEIHADFTYPGYKHQVFADLKPEFSELAITCTAPTKTFNLAGLQIANTFISNSEMRIRFKKELAASGAGHVGIMGLDACRAAYSYGRPWLEELKSYLWSNLGLLRRFLQQNLPGISLVEPEGTYLTWLDFQNTGLTARELDQILVEKGRLWLDAGSRFGAGGELFQRMNIACPEKTLQEALYRLARAFS